DDVEADFRAGHLLQLALQLLDVRALLANDHAGTSRVDRHSADLRRALDHDLRDRGLRRLLENVTAELQVFEQQPSVLLTFREPAAVPGTVDLQAKADRRGFLTHYASSCSRTMTRRRLNGLTIREERPRARVMNRFLRLHFTPPAPAARPTR